MKKLLLSLISAFAFATSAMAAVDLNSANQQQLESVKGIGPAKAKAILEYRQKNGPFKTVDDLTKVPGIKAGTLAKIKAEISVGGRAPAVAPAKPAAAPAAPAAAPAKK